MSRRRYQLYRHYDAAGELLYVGISISAVARMAAHKSGGSCWVDDVALITIETFPSRVKALAAERAAIQNEHPKWNVAHVVKRRVVKHAPTSGEPHNFPSLYEYHIGQYQKIAASLSEEEWLETYRKWRRLGWPGAILGDPSLDAAE